MEYKNWTPDEQAYLADNWGKLPPKEIAKHLERTVDSVQVRACKYKLTRRKEAKWSDEEIQRIQELWGIKTIPQISKELGRSKTAIKVKSTRMKLGAFKNSSEYLPAQQISYLLGIDVHTVTDYWIPKCGLKSSKIAPLDTRTFTYIRITHLLEWLRVNQDKWDSRRMAARAFGPEPEWLKKKRKADAVLPERKNQKYTEQEDKIVVNMFKSGRYTYQKIGERIGRTAASVEHRVSRLDIWGTGKYVGNTKQVKRKEHREKFERLALLTQLCDAFLCRRNQLAFDGYWQKSMCMHWENVKGCTANETDCDACVSFQRIQPQYCARCGRTFYERQNNRFCVACRQARKKSYQRKWAHMRSKAR